MNRGLGSAERRERVWVSKPGGSGTSASGLARRMTLALPTIGFFGIGEMGAAMAERLAASGYAVAVSDPDTARVTGWRARHGAISHEAADAAIIVSCVTDAAALAALMLGESGLVMRARQETLFIDHTTASPDLARALEEAAVSRQALFVDAPVSGGREGAARGALSVMVGGTDKALARAAPVLGCYAGLVTHLGEAGAGQAAKLANQIAIAGTVRGLAEAVTLARAYGVDSAALLRALAAGTAASAQLDRLDSALAGQGWRFDQLFAWLGKDLDLALAAGKMAGAPLPLAELVTRLLDAR